MATKGTKTQLVTFVLFVVRQHFSPGLTQYRKRQILRFAGKMTCPIANFARGFRVYSWFFPEDSFVNCARDRFRPDEWEKLEVVDGFCC